MEECIEVFIAQCRCQNFYALVLLVHMNGTKDGAIRNLLSQFRKLLQEFLFRNLTEDVLAKEAAHFFQFIGDCRIFISQICVVSAAVNDAKRISCFSKVEVDLLDLWLCGILKVNVNQAANTGCHLIHQTAGLAEVNIFGILANLCDLYSRQLFVIEQFVQNGTEQHLKGSRGTEAAAGKNRGTDSCIKTFQFCPLLGKAGSDAANQSRCGVLFFFTDSQIIQGNLNSRITLGLHTDDVAAIKADICNGFQIHRGCENAAALVIGMVTTDFRSARSREYKVFFHNRKS